MGWIVVNIDVFATKAEIDKLDDAFHFIEVATEIDKTKQENWNVFDGDNHIAAICRAGADYFTATAYLTDMEYFQECLEKFFLPYVSVKSIKYWATDDQYLFLTNDERWECYGGTLSDSYPCPDDGDEFSSGDLSEQNLRFLLMRAFKRQGKYNKKYLKDLNTEALIDLACYEFDIYIYKFKHKELGELFKEYPWEGGKYDCS